MITIIKQILNGSKQPDLLANISSDKYFEALLRDVETIPAIFKPAYYHELKNIAYFPPKAKLYMRWIDNAITEYLNQYLSEDTTSLSVSLIRFRHYEFTKYIESYIAQFDQRIQQNPLSYSDIAGTNVDPSPSTITPFSVLFSLKVKYASSSISMLLLHLLQPISTGNTILNTI